MRKMRRAKVAQRVPEREREAFSEEIRFSLAATHRAPVAVRFVQQRCLGDNRLFS